MVRLHGEKTICSLHQALLTGHISASLTSYVAICLHKNPLHSFLRPANMLVEITGSQPELMLGFLSGSAEVVQDAFVTDV